MAEDKKAETTLWALLERVYKFPHNVGILDLLREVYGEETETNKAYVRSKLDMLQEKGFTWWYCDLDIGNQLVVVRAILGRYPEVADLLNGKETKDGD